MIETKSADIASLIDGTRDEFPFSIGETEIVVSRADVLVQYQASEGWAGVADRGTHVALDTRITEELALEGLAREIIRYVQDARKNAGLAVEDRIVLFLGTESPKLQAAIDAHRHTIAAETLVANGVLNRSKTALPPT